MFEFGKIILLGFGVDFDEEHWSVELALNLEEEEEEDLQ